MNTVLIDQLQEAIAGNQPWTGLACESPLRVAASILVHADPREMTATRVVGTIGQDDFEALYELVADIADDFGLESNIQVRNGSFAVRFSRC